MTAQFVICKDGNLLPRRAMFAGAAASLILAPSIVRATSLMRVHSLNLPVERTYFGFAQRLFYHSLERGVQAGHVGTSLNGKIVSMEEARRLVAWWTRHK